MPARRSPAADMAQLAGDPRSMGHSPGASQQPPYTRPQSSGNAADQYSELVHCRLDGALKRLMEEQVLQMYPWYRTLSDYVRDACFKWAQHLHEEWFSADSPTQPVVAQLDVISKQAWESERNREFAETMAKVSDALMGYIKDGDESALPKLAQELAGYVEKIQSISDTYWKKKTIRAFKELQAFGASLQLLKNDSRYKDSELIRVMTVWKNSQ